MDGEELTVSYNITMDPLLVLRPLFHLNFNILFQPSGGIIITMCREL